MFVVFVRSIYIEWYFLVSMLAIWGRGGGVKSWGRGEGGNVEVGGRRGEGPRAYG